MGCGTCGTKTADGTPAGCRSNGTCGTTGCNKLNVYNWLSDMELPNGQTPYDIVEVRFKGARKEYFRNANNLELREGDMVAVEGNPGHDIGMVSLQGELVRLQLKKKNFSEGTIEIKSLFRLARPADLEKYEELKAAEHETMHISRKIALELGLTMKLSDVEYQGDGKKVTFFYTAEDRVDFRELIKRLADKFKTRIEMRQIGMRQEASRLGALGMCGRELCCSTWLTDFKAVTTNAARYQNLSLNPLKLAGQCGKLKCCLNYELDAYMDAVRDFPDTAISLHSQKGSARHIKTDIFKRMMWYSLQPMRDGDEPAFVGGGEWVPLSVDRVKEIIALNKQNIKPEELRDEELEDENDYQPDYENVVGQDSITRMDNKKKKKKKKKSSSRAGDGVHQTSALREEGSIAKVGTNVPPRVSDKPQPAAPARGPQQQPAQGRGNQQPNPNRNQQPSNRAQQQKQNKPPQQQQRPPHTNAPTAAPKPPQQQAPKSQPPRPPVQQNNPAPHKPAPPAADNAAAKNVRQRIIPNDTDMNKPGGQ